MSKQDPNVRIGHGYDLHRLAPTAAATGQATGHAERGRPMVLGGVQFQSPVGPIGHSDADALLHAITDAVLGALALPDIGQLFPDSNPQWSGAASEKFLREAVRLAAQAGWRIGNVDATVILESPKLGPRKDEVRRNIARILEVDVGSVNVKGKTHEKVDAVGEGRAVEVHAVVVLVRS